ncbi:MAG: FAD-dependent oxidoreductase [Bacteroidota bacterium]
MDLRSHNPFWLLNSGIIATYPSLRADKKTEVVIMGAGITGALVAWHLCKKGFRVIIVDKRHVGMGSTAASTALLQYEIDTPMSELALKIGEQKAARSYALCIKTIHDLDRICHGFQTDVDFRLKESFQYASSIADARELEKEFALRKKHGIDIQWLTSEEVKKKFGFHAPAGVLSREGAQVDAYKLTHALLAQAMKWGLVIYDSTEVVSIGHHRKKVILSTNDGFKITAGHLVIACGYESQKYIPQKIEKFNSTYAIVSEPLANKNLWYHNCLIWETATPYLYLRTTSDNRILIGGKDDPISDPKRRDENLARKVKTLEKAFARLFPQHTFKTDFQWAGTFASTKDGLPYIGSVPSRANTSFALGFGGNGITFSVLAAQLILDKLLGKVNKDAALFAFNR